MEKTGNTEKIKYDFETAANLELFMPNLNDWYRVTSREFRAFNGKRRINNVEYNGNVYLYGTNKLADLTVVEHGKLAGYSWASKRRPGEDLA
jgi:hypothetical protein